MSLSNKLIRAGVQSGTIMATADVITQYFVEEKHTMKQYDPTRTVRWGIAGLICHGPYFFIGFSAIDKYVVGKRSAAAASLAMVAKKTLVAQLVLFPPYLVLLFGLMGVLEGKSTQHEIIQKIRQRVPAAFIGGCVYWPVANGLNFYLIRPNMRVPYSAFSAGIWNSYLSWENERAIKASKKWWRFWA